MPSLSNQLAPFQKLRYEYIGPGGSLEEFDLGQISPDLSSDVYKDANRRLDIDYYLSNHPQLPFNSPEFQVNSVFGNFLLMLLIRDRFPHMLYDW